MNSNEPQQSTILIVDDKPEELKALIVFLEESGFQILAAHSGEAALKRLNYVRPDIILLDVLMPGMDGFETCRRLKELEAARAIPVIFMTALAEMIDKVKGFEVGGVDYLTKPVQHEEVLARVNTHLTNHRLQQQIREEKLRFQALTNASFEGILIHHEGEILDVNPALEKMFGFQCTEVSGRNILEFIAPDLRQVVLKHLQTKDEIPYETEGIKKDGTNFSIELQARPMPYDGYEARVVSIRDLSWRKIMEEEKQQFFRATMQDRYKFGKIIGKSSVMLDVYQAIVKASASEANVVIYGESGTGKELVAQAIHQMSPRKYHNFVAVNCGAVPASLFEREFFGHRKGAFTGAAQDKTGYFDLAHKGTLFLDEVGELAPDLQVKLLRVLENKEFRPVGDTRSKKADVRIIAATNKNLKEQLQQGKVREDFFYRIYVMRINLPPLRNRKEDIPLLIQHFLEHYGKSEECSAIPGNIMYALCEYHWPGNVRELQNELQRYLTGQGLDFIGQLSPGSMTQENEFNPGGLSFRDMVERYEKELLTRALEQNAGHLGKTSEMLEIPSKTLYRKIHKYDLQK